VHADPSGEGQAAIDHVTFTAAYGGTQHVVSIQTSPAHDDVYKYLWRLGGVPRGWVVISFDVYDTAGGHTASPDGTRKIWSRG